MNLNFIIIDDFLEDPDTVRKSAIQRDFYRSGPWPGFRSTYTDPDYNDDMKKKFEKIINSKIIHWQHHKDGIPFDTGCFQLCLENSKTWIHGDECEYTGILFLTPDAPCESGTAIYRHKPTGVFEKNKNNAVENDTDEKSWEIISYAGNVYNRLLILRGCQYHSSLMPGFGQDKYNGRLTQNFFFNTEKYLL